MYNFVKKKDCWGHLMRIIIRLRIYEIVKNILIMQYLKITYLLKILL